MLLSTSGLPKLGRAGSSPKVLPISRDVKEKLTDPDSIPNPGMRMMRMTMMMMKMMMMMRITTMMTMMMMMTMRMRMRVAQKLTKSCPNLVSA